MSSEVVVYECCLKNLVRIKNKKEALTSSASDQR